MRTLALSVLALLALAGCSIIEGELPPTWRSHFRPKVGDGKGVVLLSFDDRNFAGWKAALPIFDKYRAHATFFVSGPIDKSAIDTMQLLCAKGHSVGLHGLRHRNADKAVVDMGEEMEDESLLPELEAGYAALEKKLSSVGYAYDPARNQFALASDGRK